MGDKRFIEVEENEHMSKYCKRDFGLSTLQLNNGYFDDSVIKMVSDCWHSKKGHKDDFSGVELFQDPFCHCVLPNFIQDAKSVDELSDELRDLEFVEKNNDLYKFHQSKEDLKSAKSPHISAFRQLLCTKFRDWLSKITGIPLNDTVDMFCAQYISTDTLLCHDDELEGRRIAYIYYLVNSWTQEDGGALDLYSVDGNIQPDKVVKSIYPTRNNFVLFEVSPGSFHQVAEVLSQDKMRLSVGGWFHGPPISRPTPFVESPRSLLPYATIDDDTFFDWINPVYLSVGAQGSIQEKFENQSQIELQDFLQKDKYEELLCALKSSGMCWSRRGPPNRRCYDQPNDSNDCPSAVRTCIELLKSDAMFLLLSNCTGLKLHELAGENSDSESDVNTDPEQGSDNSDVENAIGISKGDAGSDNTDKAGTSGVGSICVEKKLEEEIKDADTVTMTKTINDCVEQNAAKDNIDTECSARCRCEARRWTPGSYTLVHDTDTEGSEFALDLVLYIGCQGWEIEYGGFTSYITRGEDEELLTVTPEENSLALVYRDKETLKFVKHLNSGANSMVNKGFYDISAVYYE